MSNMIRLPNGPKPLTDRERQILELKGSGLSDHEIGRRLGILAKSVHSALARAYAKGARDPRFR